MRVLTRRELEERLYGPDEAADSNALEADIHGLRRKIGADQIVSVRGVGYRLKRAR
jgi:two-component system response regulator QseB